MAGYWKKRYLKDKAVSINKSEKYIVEQQEKYYAAAQKEIRKDIEDLYRKFADKENITLAEAKRQIGRSDFAKIDFGKMVDYQIEKNREFKKKKDKLPGDVVAAIEAQHARYESGLRAYTKKGQITRLELLSLQIDKAMLDLYDKNQISMYDCLSQIYEDGYYRSVFAGQKAIGFGKDFTAPNIRAVERAVLATYNKKGYSKRLYGHCSAFSKDLKENLVTGLIKGESLDKMSTRMSTRLNISAAYARRLVRTETAYIYEQASLKAYTECGIEKYEFLATLDHKTSKPCQELDGKRFHIEDAMPGKNYPPMHPNCRSTTVAAFDDDKATKRLAKDKSGKYYEVPSDMTYPEWKNKYMGGRMTGVSEKAEPVIRPHQPGLDIEKERLAINTAIKMVPTKVREALNSGTIIDVGKTGASQYDYNNDILYVAKGADTREVIHEIGHMVENKMLLPEKGAVVKQGFLENVPLNDCVKEIYYDAQKNPVEIFLLKNDRFVSEYQGRLYVNDWSEIYNEQWEIRGELLQEFISEPFREYIENPKRLKDYFPDFYELIRETVE